MCDTFFQLRHSHSKPLKIAKIQIRKSFIWNNRKSFAKNCVFMSEQSLFVGSWLRENVHRAYVCIQHYLLGVFAYHHYLHWSKIEMIPPPAIPISSLDPVILVEGQSYRQAASCRSVARPPPRLSWDTDLNGQSINRSSDNGAVSSHYSLHPLRGMNGKKLDCLVWHPTLKAPRRITNNLVVHCEYSSEFYRGSVTWWTYITCKHSKHANNKQTCKKTVDFTSCLLSLSASF